MATISARGAHHVVDLERVEARGAQDQVLVRELDGFAVLLARAQRFLDGGGGAQSLAREDARQLLNQARASSRRRLGVICGVDHLK